MTAQPFGRLSEFEPEVPEWLWHPYLPYGMVSILEGDPNLGKTFLAMALASIVSSGGKLPDGKKAQREHALYISFEDDPAFTLRPRADAMDGDAQRIHVLKADFQLDDHGFKVLRELLEMEQFGLVIIDPIGAAIPPDVGMNRSNSIRPILTKLRETAAETECAIVFVRHLTKMQHDNALYQGSGSMDYIGAVRSALRVVAHPENHEKRVMMHIKHNLSQRGQSWSFHIEGGSETEIPRLVWDGPSDVSIDDIGGATKSTRPRQFAEMFLHHVLKEGPRSATHIEKLASEIGVSKKTLRRAKEQLRVGSIRKGKEWIWKLP